ncbi:MAG TPA: hypothetical protein VN229_12390 [Terriglobales bacterium]|nr:hypothetical protein [Terriglobales bacterium]
MALISLPKAGTYLLSEVARQFGWLQSYWHVREGSFEDYSAGSMEERRHRPDRFHQQRNIADTAEALPAGAFFVGHIAHSDSAIAALSRFRKILAVRELRSALVSRLCFERRLRRSPHLAPIWQVANDRLQMQLFLRQQGPALFAQFLSILPWMVEPDVLTLRFEDLRQPDLSLARQLTALLNRENLPLRDVSSAAGEVAGLDVLRNALAADTLTKSPEQTDVSAFWSAETEALFLALGGGQMNKAMGYEALAETVSDNALMSELDGGNNITPSRWQYAQ